MAWMLRAYVQTGAAMLTLAGLAILYAATGDERLHGQADPLFRLTNRAMLVLFGVAHLAFGGVLLAARDVMNQGIITLWIGVNYLAYRVGMALVNAAIPFPAVRLVGWRLGIRPSSVEICWRLLTAYLVVGSLLHMMLAWRRLKQIESEALLKQWKGMREQGAVALAGDARARMH